MSKRKPEPNGRSLEELLRRIIREEVGSRFDAVGEQLGSLGDRLGSLEKRVTAGFAWTEEQFEWVSQRFDAVDQRFDAVREDLGELDRKLTERFDRLEQMLGGVIDKDFPPIDQQGAGGPPASGLAIAAKGKR